MFALDYVFKRLFTILQFTFPSSLAGCGALFLYLLLVQPETASQVFASLQPGAALLAKWLPVFFVPSLVTLPLASGGGGGGGSLLEWIKVGTVVVGGFFFTLLSTALSVVCVRQVGTLLDSSGRKSDSANATVVESVSSSSTTPSVIDAEIEEAKEEGEEEEEEGNDNETKTDLDETLPPDDATNKVADDNETETELLEATAEVESDADATQPSTVNATAAESSAIVTTTTNATTSLVTQRGPFSNQVFYILVSLSTIFGSTATLSSWLQWSFVTPATTTLFFLCTTLSSFVYGTRLPKQITKWIHPLLTCTAITWTTLATFCLLTGMSSFQSVLRLYRSGSTSTLSPLPFAVGAGQVLLYCLGPAVVSLAVSMYERRKLMRDNIGEVGAAIATSTVGGVFGTAALVRWLEIGDPTLRLALLSRNITSPLAMAIARILGANVSMAVSMVVVTGLIGANFGAAIFNALGIRNPVARGMGMGAAAHGLGTAAIADEPDAFPFAAIAMALTASAATVTVSIPFFRRVILELALGW